MSLMDAFSDACGEFPAFRAAVVQARDLTTDPGTRAQLNHVLDSLDRTYADFRETFPKAAADVQRRFANVQEQAKKVQANVAGMKETIAKQQAAEAAAAASAPIPATVPAALAPVLPAMVPLDLQAGLRARDELLKRFGIARPVASRDDEGSVDAMDAAAWSPPAAEDDWPAELRTPSFKKPPQKAEAPRPAPPPPATDDDSFGKSTNDSDDWTD